MSKQATANHIYFEKDLNGWSRSETIANIADALGCADGYASTLYNNARKASNPPAPKKPKTVTSTKSTKTGSNKYASMGRSKCDPLRKDLEDALAELHKKFGVRIEIGSMRYNDNSISTKLEVFSTAAPSKSDEKKSNFALYANMLGLKPEWFGKTFIQNGATFEITGVKPSRRKYPVSCKKVGGGSFKFAAETVIRLMK